MHGRLMVRPDPKSLDTIDVPPGCMVRLQFCENLHFVEVLISQRKLWRVGIVAQLRAEVLSSLWLQASGALRIDPPQLLAMYRDGKVPRTSAKYDTIDVARTQVTPPIIPSTLCTWEMTVA